ncbi:ciliary microtubule-associated protein 3 [Herpailurus yagouaroundi]|uniref:ciliary microtubule-associated protein 3 n=1 Tax=Herpailurus yagouaroundi TaxID=1608482 RepID=UPI001AD74A09|nr:protein pitchfork [Puma yagouaroundi]
MMLYPGMYQTAHSREQKHKQNFAPFNTFLPRFRTDSKDTYYPGYVSSFLECFNKQRKTRAEHVALVDQVLQEVIQHVCNCGAEGQGLCLAHEKFKDQRNIDPDNTPSLQLSTDKDFRKHRNCVAYLSLFYN